MLLLAQGSTLALKLFAGTTVGEPACDGVAVWVGLALSPELALDVGDGLVVSEAGFGPFRAAKRKAPPSRAARPSTRKPTMARPPDPRRGGSSS